MWRLGPWTELNWDEGLLGPIGRKYREGPWPRFRDRVKVTSDWRYRPVYGFRKPWRSPPWSPLPPWCPEWLEKPLARPTGLDS